MTWYARSWQHMQQVHQQAQADGKFAHAIATAIDESYPFSERSGWAYKAWLDARREFFRKHDLPLRRARKPGADLLTELQP
ncbi:hypothetical protein [Stutzerimonas nitrititolerans]|uniref:hypothetical protein n=1 Tax=Stutzerimonas nitrititolerans TaxID=2482751 RepID=UPI0028A75C81|nr:hypothetical protein [Stutzerimonas nitrititolerans]